MSDELQNTLFNGARAPTNGAEMTPPKPKKLMDGGHDPRVIGAATQFKKGNKGGPGGYHTPFRDAGLRLMNRRKAAAVVEAQWRAATDPEKPSTSAAEWLRDTCEGRRGSSDGAPTTQIELIVDML